MSKEQKRIMNETREQNLSCDVPGLWKEHKEALRQFIKKRVSSKDMTEDILHDVLLKVYNFCMTKSGVKNVRSWLYQIAQNTIIDYYRKNKNIVLVNALPEVKSGDTNKSSLEAADYIIPLIGLLPPDYAVPLRLSDIEGMKHKEIALRLNLGLSATKSRIQRARQMLMSKFIECCNFERDKTGKLISFDIKSDCKPLQDYKRTIKE